MKKRAERRRYNRFRVKEGAFAMIMSAPAQLEQIEDMSMGEIALAVLKAKPVQMGQIVNISQGGLAFRYIDSKLELDESFGLDILFARDGFYLKKVPFKVVSDFNTVSKFSIGTFKMKQQGVRFGDMMPDQQSQLDLFIQNHTTSEA